MANANKHDRSSHTASTAISASSKQPLYSGIKAQKFESVSYATEFLQAVVILF
jgi:hypothetical protein